MAMGIPHEALPVTNNGDALLYNHLQWMEQRRLVDLEKLLGSGDVVQHTMIPVGYVVE